jgi:hypothetical protein
LEKWSLTATTVLVESYINPGAGLKNLIEPQNDSDVLFDTLFMTDVDGGLLSNVSSDANKAGPMARTYGSDAAV